MKTLILNITLLALFVISCTPTDSGTRIEDFGPFTLSVPSTWKKFQIKGIDTYAGGLTNGSDTLEFDYGVWAPQFDLSQFDPEDSVSYRYARDTIQGIEAYFVVPEKPGKGITGMSMDNLDTNRNSLAIYGLDVKDAQEVLSILKTVTIKALPSGKEKKPTTLSYSSEPIKSGHLLFQTTCGQCHSTTKVLIGPPLEEPFKNRTRDWIYDFLTKASLRSKDSVRLVNLKTYDRECHFYPKLTQEDFDLIYSYINSH